MNIIQVKREHFDDWLAMRQTLYTDVDDAFHRQEMETIAASTELAAFLGESADGNAIYGLLELSLRNLVDGCIGGPVGYIEGLYVKPAYRGRGFGKQFAAFAEGWCASRGCRDIATDSELENDSAQEFFRRAGFQETWRIVEFKKTLG